MKNWLFSFLISPFLVFSAMPSNADELTPFCPIIGYCGYIDRSGEWIIGLKFDRVNEFSENGLARALSAERWGFIDSSGSWVVQPRFDSLSDYSEGGLARVETEQKYHVYRAHAKTRNLSCVTTLKLSDTWVRKVFHSLGRVSRKNRRIASANCFCVV